MERFHRFRSARAAAVSTAIAALAVARTTAAQQMPFGWTWHAGSSLRGQISAFAQGDLQFREGSQSELTSDGRDSLQYDRFLLRRARILATAETRWARMLLEIDANTVDGPAIGIQNAEAMLRWLRAPSDPEPVASLAVGLFRVPFGRQNLLTPREWGFFEPPLYNRAFFPGHSDLGARLSGRIAWFRYDVAWTNGHPLGERNWALRAPTPPGDFVGRIGVDGSLSRSETEFSAGVSALGGTGFHAGTPATPDMLVYRDVHQTGAFDPRNVILVPGQPATASRTFGRWGAALDASLSMHPVRAWRFTLFGEVAYASNLDRGIAPADPVTAGNDVREIGWMLGYTQTMFDHVVSGIRVEGYDPNADALGAANGRPVPVDQSYFVATFHLAVALDRSTLLGVEYVATRDHLAIDRAGRPADLANNTLLFRLQAGF